MTQPTDNMPTPETDAFIKTPIPTGFGTHEVWCLFARALERQRNAALAKVEEATKERDEAVDENNALKVGGRELRNERNALERILHEIYLTVEGDCDGSPDRSAVSSQANVIVNLIPENLRK